MTTIAYKEGIIAYDSYLTSDIIVDKDYNKKIVRNGLVFFTSGLEVHFLELIDCYLNESKVQTDLNCMLLMVEKGKLYKVLNTNSLDVVKDLVDLNKPSAIGSGRHFALGAMDFGASAKQAVKIASGRDLYTGGRIRTYKLYK